MKKFQSTKGGFINYSFSGSCSEKMSQVRETSHGPFMPCKFFAFSTKKPCDIRLLFTRLALLICLVTTISLALYSDFPSQTRWRRFPKYISAVLNSGNSCRTPGHISGEDIGPTNISHILFGIGGSVATWNDRSNYTQLWWDINVTRGFVWLDEEPGKPNSRPKISPPYRVSEGWSRFKYSSSQSAVRIARIVLESFELCLPNVRWFVMGDDDTVFFADNLVSVLARYDHRQMYYIGGNSESVEQDVMHSYDMAFGGGGFAISYPLAAELVKVLDGCIDRYYTFYGSDQRIWACVSELGVSLTRERGFHQFDIRGDPYGLLAAHPVAPLVSLHHLDYLNPIFPNQTQLDSLKSLIEAYRVDPGRTVQQSFCYDRKRKWSVSIAWGYTVQIYPSLVPPMLLEMPMQTFQTWRSWSNEPFTFNTRPIKSDPCEQPVIYFLDRVEEVNKSETLTSYKRFVANPGKECNRSDYAYALALQRITVYALKVDPEDWKKAPRRQCCEIMDGRSIKKSTMHVRVRRCKPWETVTT